MAPAARKAAAFDATNSTMSFATGREKGFTRTPANVKADYVLKPTPASSKKRKSTTTDSTPKSTTRKPTAKSVPDDIAAKSIKRRKTGPKQASTRAIPRTFDECVEADKILITMRDAGKNWTEIRLEWEKLTGEKTGTSSLPNRYSRLKSNFTVIKEEDNARLMEAKREVEESFEAQKWDLVARVVGEKGGDSYAGVVLKRQYRKLMIAGGVQQPEGVKDPDFEGVASDAED